MFFWEQISVPTAAQNMLRKKQHKLTHSYLAQFSESILENESIF